MIPNVKDRELESQGVTAEAVFGISIHNAAHIMTILRDTLYTDKVMAVLREYSANAWDAHREFGKADTPINIVLPTSMDPTLRIQDFGRGMSQQEVFEVYTQYGASTKRNSDNTVGTLGIGSKSGFAYSDSFTVISCHGGTRSTYVAVLDSSEKGLIQCLLEEDCGDETGITIQIAVRREDIAEFINKAQVLYKYFQPRPIINTDLPDATGSQIDMKNGLIDEKSTEDHWIAVMGCVPYRINTDQLFENGQRMVGDYVDEIKGALYFDIGEVQVNASREELKYSDSTKKAIVAKFSALMDEYVESTIKKLELGGFSYWQRRMRAKTMTQIGLPLPNNLADLCKDWVELPPHKTFKLSRGASGDLIRLPIDGDNRILIKDEDAKSLAGYGYDSDDFVVRPFDGATVDAVRKELEEVLEKANLTGIPIHNLSSTLIWTKPWAEQREEEKKQKEAERAARRKQLQALRKTNNKYQHRVFKLKLDAKWGHPYSGMWEIVRDFEPEDTQVFVILESFRYSNDSGFHFLPKLTRDIALCEVAGITPPEIYGYKSTEKKPIAEKDVTGIPYHKWRKILHTEAALRPKILSVIEDIDWARAFPSRHHAIEHNILYVRDRAKAASELAVEHLGPRHPLTKWLLRALQGISVYKALKDQQRAAVEDLRTQLRGASNRVAAPNRTLKMFYRLYPMFDVGYDNIAEFWSSGIAKTRLYAQYVKDMDQFRRLQNRSKK